MNLQCTIIIDKIVSSHDTCHLTIILLYLNKSTIVIVSLQDLFVKKLKNMHLT